MHRDNVAWFVETQMVLRKDISLPSLEWKNKSSKIQPEAGSSDELCLAPTFILASCLTYFSTLKMEAACSSEMSVNFQRITRTGKELQLFYACRFSFLCSYWISIAGF
jgi:hypothetical protein